jgi:tRNA pseudouridine38-40 synthase
MPTYRLVVEYDGTDFHGFQFQPQLRTVAGVLEGALCSLFHAEISVAAAGRTDAGVHATGQVVSFKSPRQFPIERLALAMNATLPNDVSVREADFAAKDFSARFDAYERIYEYVILNRPMPSAVLRRWTHHVHRPIDDALLERVGQDFVGTHDFLAFCGVLPEFGGTERTVNSFSIERTEDIVRIHISAEGFLHRMVRIAVGTAIEIATHRRPPDEIPAIIASKDRRKAGYTAPASGLYLAGVRYQAFDSYHRPALAYSRV